MKKFIFLILCFLIPFNGFAFNDTSKSSVVMDLDSGRILYSKDMSSKRLIASTTKIMTAILALEYNQPNKIVEVGDEVLKMYGTNIYVEVGEKQKIIDLVYGLLLRSGNDASVVLADAVSGSEEEFVKAMNKKAKEIGMSSTIFQNPHGLDEETQNYSTAYDMALLSKYAYKNKTYRKIVKTKKYEVSTGEKTYLWYNRNKLLGRYEYCTGGKNGYTPDAGRTLVTTASKNNLNLTVVTLNDGNEYNTHEELYETMFSQYKRYKIVDKSEFAIDDNFVENDVYIKKSFYYPLNSNEVDKIKTVVSIDNTASKKVGFVKIYLDNEEIGRIPIYQKKKNKEKSFFSSLFSYLIV